MGTPLIDDAINGLQLIWDISPTPMKIIIGICAASVLLFAFDFILTYGSLGLDMKSKLTIGAHVDKECNVTFPQCINNPNAVLYVKGVVPSCISAASFGDPQCKIHYYAKLSEPTANGSSYGVWFYIQEPYNQSLNIGHELQWGERACDIAINGCTLNLQSILDISYQNAGINCSNFETVDYYNKLHAWQKGCQQSGGIYLLDYKLWFFGSLLFYSITIVLQYYGSTWKQ